MHRSAAFAIIAVLTAAGQARAGWQDLDRFFAVLAEERCQVVDAGETDLVFVLGAAPRDPSPAALEAYVRDGGALVIASESARANPLLRRFSFELEPDLAVTWSPNQSFKGQPDFPLIRAFNRGFLADFFRDVGVLATDRARAIDGGGEVLATFPAALPLSGLVAPKAAFMRYVRRGEGRVLAFGDQSLFIDLMIGEADNERFLRNILRSFGPASGGAEGARRVAVFLNGLPVTSAEHARVPEAPPRTAALPGPASMSLAPEVEDLNRLIADIEGSLPLERLGVTLLPAFLFLGALILFLLLLRQILNAYIPGRVPRRRAASPATAGPLLAWRLAALAPAAERVRLFRGAIRCRKPAAFGRFVERVSQAMTKRTTRTDA